MMVLAYVLLIHACELVLEQLLLAELSICGLSRGGGPCVCHEFMAGKRDLAICMCLCLISCRISPRMPCPFQYLSLRQFG